MILSPPPFIRNRRHCTYPQKCAPFSRESVLFQTKKCPLLSQKCPVSVQKVPNFQAQKVPFSKQEVPFFRCAPPLSTSLRRPCMYCVHVCVYSMKWMEPARSRPNPHAPRSYWLRSIYARSNWCRKDMTLRDVVEEERANAEITLVIV